ncbi:MAG TPA: hypothetical protein VF777_08765 [Phycisphaerales bacterium]
MRHVFRTVMLLTALSTPSLCATAQVYTAVPRSFEFAESNHGILGPIGDSIGGAVSQTIVTAQALSAVPPGSVITSIQLRRYAWSSPTPAWPVSASSITDFRVTLAQTDRTRATVSGTLANNLIQPVQVRSGALTLSAGAYPGSVHPTPANWGPVIAFQTPYEYKGGSLVIEIRNSGAGTTTTFTEATPSSDDVFGYSNSQSGANATTATSTWVPVVRIGFYTAADFASPLGAGVTKVFAAPQYADIDASSTTSTMSQSQPRTMVSVVGSSVFDNLGRGSWITGMSFRGNNAALWPTIATSFSKYEVQLSRSASNPGSLANLIASNVGADAVLVRSGALAVAEGALQKSLSGTTPFSWEIPFATPYSYRGGPLLSVVRHDGAPVTAGGVDSIPGTDPLFNTLVQSRNSTTSSTDTQAVNAVPFPVTRYSVDAQTIVPLASADGPTADANNGNAGVISGFASTYQMIIAASELRYIRPGSIINSVSFQNLQSPGVPAWPDTSSFAADFTIELSQARRTPSTMSRTFSDNIGGDKLVVRSGPLAWGAGALPAGSSKAFGATVMFDRGYVYQGGDLCITFRKSSLTNASTKLQGAGPSSLVRGVYADGNAATRGAFDSVSAATALQFGYIPSDQTPSNVRFIRQSSGGGRYVLGGNLTHQMVFNPEVIGVPIGATINGVSWKLLNDDEDDFPYADLSFARFDITLSTAAVRAENVAEQFTLNDGSDVTTVRSGPLTIPARSYRSRMGSTSNDFGFFIPFSKPFVYRGGPLAMTLRQSEGSIATNVNFEASTQGANASRSFGDPDATNGRILGDAVVSQFAFTQVARCPADLNNDAQVDDADFQVFVLAYDSLDCAETQMPFGCPSDFNYDRVVDDQDFQTFVVAYDVLLCP